MPTEALQTRAESESQEKVSQAFVWALALHGVVAATLFGAAFLSHNNGKHWGEQVSVAGSIQASMVNALPLPPKQRYQEKAVLASDNPSIAPTPPPPEPVKTKPEPMKPKAEPPPKPNEVLIPTKTKPPRPVPKTALKHVEPTPAPQKRVFVPPTPPTPKATTGETAGIQIPQSITQMRSGTATVTVEERAFGDRYAYYIRLIAQKINESKSQGEVDPPDARGKRTAVRFTIDRDGVPIEADVVSRSGSAALDTSTLRAIQRIDSFGPLPQGSRLTVTFGFTDK